MEELKRLFEIPGYSLKKHPATKAVGHRGADGNFVYWSSAELVADINKTSLGLLELGVRAGDKVALISYVNRPEWNILDMAIQQIGAINVPVYPTISPREYEYIFNDAQVKLCFVSMDGKGDLLKKVRAAQPNVPSLEQVYTFDKTSEAIFWRDIQRDGDMGEVNRRAAAIQSGDLATIIYTSGTTGNPKGVMLSHDNILSNLRAVDALLPIVPGETAISFLPLCHIFERTVSYTYLAKGISVTYVGTDNLGGDNGDLRTLRPHFFTSVPRLLEKVYEKIVSKGYTLKFPKRNLFFWALDLTDAYEYDKEFTGLDKIKRNIADKLIFSKWREALGGNIRGIVTGAAACPQKIVRVFSAAGVPIREAYGLTETSPGLTIGRFSPHGAKIGCVGPALKGVTIKIDTSDGNYREGEGEILVQGPNIMLGYYNKPEATADVMKGDWFCTGDVGRIVQENGEKYLQITDRKKELLKTSGGKYVAPAPIESRLKEDFFIEQAMVVGEGQKFVSALIVPAFDTLKNWCAENNIAWNNVHEVLANPQVVEHFQKIINEVNPNFSHIEQIKKFELLADEWDVLTGELTPTLKLKRRIILDKYKALIDKIYAS